MTNPIYLGSQTLVEQDGSWSVEHRDHEGMLTRTEIIGDLLALNYRLLGLAKPVRRGI